jgi:hypothetical protein
MKRLVAAALLSALVGLPITARASSSVPWSQVGSGWILSVVNHTFTGCACAGIAPPAHLDPEPTQLTLVSPAGQTYVLKSWPYAAGTGSPPIGQLVDWSGDRRPALFLGTDHLTRSTLTELDLRTGHTRTVKVPTVLDSAGYTLPTGQQLIVDVDTGRGRVDVQRWGRDGKRLVDLGAGPLVSAPDGTSYVRWAQGGLTRLSGTGQVLGHGAVSGATGCVPERFLDPGHVLLGCGSLDSKLWEVGVHGGTARRLSVADPAASGDAADLNAWPVGSGSYLYYLGGCGSSYLGRTAAGKVQQITVPGSPDSVVVLAKVKGSFDILTKVAGCYASSSLITFDPVSGRTTTLIASVPGELGVEAALVFGHLRG